MRYLSRSLAGLKTPLEKFDLNACIHVFDDDSILAVNAALAAGRPLLLRGEPGVGKSQLARAAAEKLGRNYFSVVVDARTESHDLLWRLDAVARLGTAQVLGGLGVQDRSEVKQELALDLFLEPGPLWWGFSWQEATEQWKKLSSSELGMDAQSEEGVVVLIDEIDKADSSVPNGLLEALGNQRFVLPEGRVVAADSKRMPLVVVTTNEERALPDAFLRRCIVHHMSLPAKDELKVWLCQRGAAHFPDVDHEVLEKAAELLIRDRDSADANGLSLPGQAEYLDLIRATSELANQDENDSEMDLLEQMARFTFRKHADADYGTE